MTEPYLILHKVRNEPAFDIAILLSLSDEDGEEMWVIPTSGHRAYPYAKCNLYSINLEQFLSLRHDMPPEGWPDHYSSNDRPTPKSSLLDLIRSTILPKITRRV